MSPLDDLPKDHRSSWVMAILVAVAILYLEPKLRAHVKRLRDSARHSRESEEQLRVLRERAASLRAAESREAEAEPAEDLQEGGATRASQLGFDSFSLADIARDSAAASSSSSSSSSSSPSVPSSEAGRKRARAACKCSWHYHTKNGLSCVHVDKELKRVRNDEEEDDDDDSVFE